MKFNIFGSFLLACSFLFIGCSDGDDSYSEYGRLRVQLTDAPFPHDLVAEANVTIFKIDARHKAGVEMEDAASDGEAMTEKSELEPFEVLMEEEVPVNLLDLTNGVTKTLVDSNVPVGTYDLIRVHVKGINVVMKDGTAFNLDVPSGAQSGIKIFMEPVLTVSGGLTADLLLDFDVSKSFVAKSDGFNFKPVIKASNLSTAGTLMGIITTTEEEVMLGVEGAQIAVFKDGEVQTTTFSGEEGGYMVMGLEAGSYTVIIEKEGYTMQSMEFVEIEAANKTVQDFELTPQQ
ncbi:DUF4382 domain-containing protein [Pareuzebyella sediminis]|uniref:DUF4382 domain-containing protein n=1 Tax=Pareuzebyella sediminis TaxID=2607998 RepID=UPI0011EC09B4|nr:DUF4382 domain-containing protein [Pareuzebyella sediminis]